MRHFREPLNHEMASANAHAILAQIPCDFNGGEICTSVSTLHNIHVIKHVDRGLINQRWIDT
jgi:hypothetical protein